MLFAGAGRGDRDRARERDNDSHVINIISHKRNENELDFETKENIRNVHVKGQGSQEETRVNLLCVD